MLWGGRDFDLRGILAETPISNKSHSKVIICGALPLPLAIIASEYVCETQYVGDGIHLAIVMERMPLGWYTSAVAIRGAATLRSMALVPMKKGTVTVTTSVLAP